MLENYRKGQEFINERYKLELVRVENEYKKLFGGVDSEIP